MKNLNKWMIFTYLWSVMTENGVLKRHEEENWTKIDNGK